MTTTYKQVGRNCLADFFGFDPHGAASMAEILASAGAFASASEDDFDGEGGVGRARVYRTIGEYLPFVARQIRIAGWLSKGKAYERDGHTEGATAVQADYQMNAVEAKARNGERVSEADLPNEQDRAVAKKTIDYLAEHFDNAPAATLTDYEHNLRVAFLSGVVEGKTSGIIASGINYAAKEQEKKTERVDFTNSQYVGEVGKRAIFTGLKCVFPGFGGRPVVFVDASGNKVSAWNPGFPVEKGATYNVKATPVKQDEYKGIKSTMMNRMVLATEKDLAPKAPRKPRAKKVVAAEKPVRFITYWCEACQTWAATGRPCTVSSHGECDCPKCQGMCKCLEER